ncbi:MAG: OmpA family protein [Nevskia sp.]|nr:OmpA family protein [Nevskia sp.]
MTKAGSGGLSLEGQIEGFTDSQGSDSTNLTLSQQRAAAVSTYLCGRGIAHDRIKATGRGEGYPVTGNEIAAVSSTAGSRWRSRTRHNIDSVTK